MRELDVITRFFRTILASLNKEEDNSREAKSSENIILAIMILIEFVVIIISESFPQLFTKQAAIVIIIISGIIVGASLTAWIMARILLKNNAFGEDETPVDHYGYFRDIYSVHPNDYMAVQIERTRKHENK